MIFLPYGGFFDPRNHSVSSFSPVTYHTFLLFKRTPLISTLLSNAISGERTFSFIAYKKRDSGFTTPLSPFVEIQDQDVQWNYFPLQEGTLDCDHLSEKESSCIDEYKSPPNSPEHQESWISSLVYGYRWW